MRDIKGFCKLFNIRVPVYEELEYYLTQLSHIPKYRDIKKMAILYTEMENSVGDLFDFRMKKSLELLEYIKGTNAYKNISMLYLESLPVNKSIDFKEGVKYLSIDLSKADWRSYKEYDTDNELFGSYEELMDRFNMSFLSNSKSFRQIIFGNLNPRKQSTIQRNLIQDIINELTSECLTIEYIKQDEVIFSYDKLDKETLTLLNEMGNVNINSFSVEFVEDFRINNYIDIYGNLIDREMVGCHGDLLYLNLKKYITYEKLDERDLYFKVNGKLAKWV